jgi:hypothetical protein
MPRTAPRGKVRETYCLVGDFWDGQTEIISEQLHVFSELAGFGITIVSEFYEGVSKVLTLKGNVLLIVVPASGSSSWLGCPS